MMHRGPLPGAAPGDGIQDFAAHGRPSVADRSFDDDATSGREEVKHFSSSVTTQGLVSPPHETDRWRELFPLPMSLPPEALTGRSHSESSRRRRAKVRSRVEESNSIMECLNEMYGPPVPKGHCLPMTEAQHFSHHAIFKQLARLKRPQTRCKMREAIQELLHTPISYSGDENMSTVRPYERCLVSLPECGSAPVPLHEVLDAEGRDLLKGSFNSMLLDDEEWGEVIEHETPIKPYMDTTLQNDPIKYGQFVKDLWEKGMLRFTSEPKDLVTPFFVVKKNGKLRFILDCRGVNKRFRPPPALALAAGSSWSQVSIPKGSKMFVAQSDIKDYFYSLELPHALQPLFCLPPLPSSVVQEWSSTLQGLPSSPSGWVWPMLQVVPMGWSWAMYFAQRVHQHLCLEATGLSMSQVLVEGRPAPDMSKEGVVLIPYADNLNVAGLNQNEVQHVKDTVVKHLRDKGFRVHEETEASTTAVSLGFLIDGEHGVICPIPERLDRVLSAFTWLSMEPRVSGKAVERVIGHAVHFCMLRRELLSIFRSLYDFIQHSYWHRTKLWPSAAREARWASHLLKLCSADLTREWSSDTTASDASLSGVAVCRRSMSEADQVRYGTRKEIWRYKYNLPVKPRDSAIGRPDPFTDIRTVKPIDHKSADPFVLDADFPEVDASLLKQEDWHDVFSVHMVIPEHITLLEGRGVVAALRHKLRSKHEFFKRHLHFNDNMGVVLLCSKGRSNSYPMLRVARRIACLCLAADISLSVRWIPSELNIADKASRRWEKQRIADASSGTTCEFSVPQKRSPKWIDRGNEWEADLSGDDRSREEEEEDGKQMSSSENSSRENSVQGRCEEAKNRPSSLSGADYSGKTGSVNSRGGGLQQENGGAEEIRKDAQASHDQEELGRGLLQVCEQFVRSRVRPSRRKQNPCSSYRQPPRLFPSTHAAAHKESFAGLGKGGASVHSTSIAVGPGGKFGSDNVGTAANTLRIGRPSDVHCLPATRRSHGLAGKRFGCTTSKSTLLRSPSSPCRKKRTVQGGAVRREPVARLANDALVGACTQEGPQDVKISSGSELRHVGSTLEASLDQVGTADKPCSPIPAATFRTKSRPSTTPPQCIGSEAARSMGKRQLGSKIRSSCQDQSRVSFAEGTNPEEASQDGGSTSSSGPKVFSPLTFGAKTLNLFVIEIFSGCARLSRACASYGFTAFAFDIEYNDGCDVLQDKVWKKLRRFIWKHRKKIALIWLGTPCTSWSRARRHDGGPPPLRDDHDCLITGVPFLNFHDQQKVLLGNRLLDRSVEIIDLAMSCSIPWALENPFSSRLWLTSSIARLVKAGALLHRTDFCAYGMPWRKSTGVLCWLFPAIHLAFHTCQSSNNRCAFSGHRHVSLTGKDSQGIWYTRRAQPYPNAMCFSVAKQLFHQCTSESG